MGAETWSLILREGYRYGVFENRALKRMFESRKKEPSINRVMKLRRLRWVR